MHRIHAIAEASPKYLESLFQPPLNQTTPAILPTRTRIILPATTEPN
jgi:hypothetical protein